MLVLLDVDRKQSKAASVDEMKASLKLLLDVGNGQACFHALSQDLKLYIGMQYDAIQVLYTILYNIIY